MERPVERGIRETVPPAGAPLIWTVTDKYGREARQLADRHYNRQRPGSPQFVPPGRSVVLDHPRALWVTSWPEFAQHAWAGAWVCTVFRNEGAGLSSELIRQAVAATRHQLGEPPALGMITFVDPAAVRHKRDPGRCFLRAGFVRVGLTRERQRVVLQLLPGLMPAAEEPLGLTLALALTAE